MSTPTGVLADVLLVADTGVDDALALVATVLEPRLRLAGVVGTAGNTDRDRAVSNTRFVLDVLGQQHVPVVAGARDTWSGSALAPRAGHGPDGLAGLSPRDLKRPNCAGAAADLVRQAREDSERVGHRLAMVAAGPLTVLADPDLIAAADREVALLAVCAKPGEANFAMDPVAAHVVRATWPSIDDYGPEDFALTARDEPLDSALSSAERALSSGSAGSRAVAMVAALWAHQRRRGAGLGDAGAPLRIAEPQQDPLARLAALLPRLEMAE